jgi:dephospho-CoA kinase
MVKIGVTGSICSGKSSFCNLLESTYDCIHIDADKVGHECYLPNTTCYYKLIDTFTDIIIDKETNEIDRKILGSIVFSSKEKMDELQSIVWPEIKQKLKEKMNIFENENPEKIIIVEAAILLEAKWVDLFDVVVLLYADDDVIINRLTSRNNLSIEDATKRLKSQLTINERKDKLQNVNHIIIENNQDMNSLINSNEAYTSFIQTYFVKG